MKLGVYGASGHAKEIFDLVTEMDPNKERWSEIVFVDDTKERGIFQGCSRLPFQELCEEYSSEEIEFCIGVGEPRLKEILFEKVEKAGYAFTNIVYPGSYISPSVKFGRGIIIKRHVSISSDTDIQDNVCILSNVTIGHDVIIGKHSQIASNAFIGGHVTMGDRTYLGTGSMLREEITVGEGVIVSMGAVVLKSVSDYVTVMGNPARIISNSRGEKVFKNREEVYKATKILEEGV